MVKQNAGTSDPVSFSSQCQVTAHSNILTSTYNTASSILDGETVRHLHKHNVNRTANSGTSTVSQSTKTEVTSAIGGSIVTPAVAQQDNVRPSQVLPNLLSINEMSEISQDDDGKFIFFKNIYIYINLFYNNPLVNDFIGLNA